MKITANGKEYEVEEGTTLALFLEGLAVTGGAAAVERNKAVVPRSAHGTLLLEEGDKLEIITLVGGG